MCICVCIYINAYVFYSNSADFVDVEYLDVMLCSQPLYQSKIVRMKSENGDITLSERIAKQVLFSLL